MVSRKKDRKLVSRSLMERLAEVDEIAIMVLKTHLMIEEILEDTLDRIFPEPGHLQEARLSFFQKVKIVQASSEKIPQPVLWEFVMTLNELRNEIAHRGETEGRAAKIRKLRELLEQLSGKGGVPEASDEEVVLFSATACVSFAATLEQNFIRKQ